MKRTVNNEQRAAIIEELGNLHGELSATADKAKRLAELKKLVQTWPKADKVPGGSAKIYEGAKYRLVLGAAEKKREITDMVGLFRTLGRAAFVASCSFGLGVLDKFAEKQPELSLDKYVTTDPHGGSRGVEVVAK